MAQRGTFSVKTIGATFLEAPPGRDKSIAPLGAPASLEKVEVHTVISFGNAIFVDHPLFAAESRVKATGQMADKSFVDLGTADVWPFRRTSEDRRHTLISFSVSRLPDKPVDTVTFTGAIRVMVAKSIVHKTASFDPTVGSRIDGGFGTFLVTAVGLTTVSISGGEELERATSVKITKPDGSTLAGELRATSKSGSKIGLTWGFTSPVVAGEMEFTMYEDLERIDVPVAVSVSRPS